MFKKLICLIIIVLVMWPVVYLFNLPNTEGLRTANPTTSAIRLHREDQIRKKGGKPASRMEWRPLSQISHHLVHAVILAEDDAFYRHHGFDFEQLKNAVKTNWERKKFAFGASTLTQQLARTLYLSSHKNLLRKAKEALITRKLEKSLTKGRILELYLNVVEWGPQIYGAEAAAQHFFGKSAMDLTPEEAIALAAILPSPRRWNPHSDKKFMNQRKSILYDRMVRANYLIPEVSMDELTPETTGDLLISTGPVLVPSVVTEPLPVDDQHLTDEALEEIPPAVDGVSE